jgi:PKD repeat protein
MKRLTTLILGSLAGTALMAQAPNQGTSMELAPPAIHEVVDLEEPAFYKYHPANTELSTAPSSNRGAVEYIAIGTSYNLYSILLDGQNQVSYHPDINSVLFVHRQNDGTPGGSGGLSFDVSTDGGATWTDNYVVTPDFNAGTSISTGNRYPSATIYNPDGNTDPNAAFFVGNGPALGDYPGSWGLSFRHSANLDGSNVSEEYHVTAGEEYDFHPYSLNYYSSGSMWSVQTTYNNTGDVTADSITYQKYRVNEITYNAGTMSFDYDVTTVEPDLHTYLSAGNLEQMAGYGWSVDFDATGTTGYLTLLAGAEGASPLAIKPMIYKTTDAGATWDLLPDFDFGTLLAFQDWTISTWDGEIIPFFTSHDAVVDNEGTLHIFAEYISRSTSSTEADSLYFIWNGLTGFMHLTTSDGTDWTADLMGYSTLANGVFGTVGIPYRVQASRNTNGDKVFMTWTESDSTIFTEHSAPDLLAVGYDVVSGEYTNVVNVTQGTDFEYSAYYATTSPVSMDDGAGTYEVPVVFSLPGADELSAPQYYYVKGITFTDADFGAEPAAVANFTFSVGTAGLVSFTNTSSNATSYSWDFGDGSGTSPLENPTYTYTANGTYTVCLTASNATSSDETCKDVNVTNIGGAVEDVALDAALNIFPTPASDVINITLNNNSFENLTVELFNVLGEAAMAPVYLNGTATSVDVSNLAEGNYIVKISSENGVAVRQITVIK